MSYLQQFSKVVSRVSKARISHLVGGCLLLLFVVITPTAALAVNGTFTTDQYWSGNVSVTGDIVIAANAMLHIAAGTVIDIDDPANTAQDIGTIPNQAAGKVDICILGLLWIEATEGSPALFFSSDTYAENAWNQLIISGNGVADVEGLELHHAKYGLVLGTSNTYSGVSIAYSGFEDNEQNDISIGSTSNNIDITASTIAVGGGAGIKVSSSASPTISGCVIIGGSSSTYGIDANGSGTVTITSNNISGFDNAGNTGCGVLLQSTTTGYVYDNHIETCDNGVRVIGSAVATIGASNDGNEIEGNTVGILVECVGAGSCPSCGAYAYVFHNWIHGNATGIKTVKTAGVDAGQNGAYGYNKIDNNSSYGVWNSSSCGTVTARGNNWGRNGSNQCIAAVTSGSVDANEIWCPGSGEPDGCEDCPLGAPPINTPVASRTGLTGISPNPFNPETTIHFNLGTSAQPSIAIYNVAGQLVREEELGTRSTGANSWFWDGRDSRGNPLASGVYFVRLQAGAVTDVKKAVLLK